MKVRFYSVIISFLIWFPQTKADSKFQVVVSNKPYHSIVSGIMLGIASPKLLLKGNFSPHRYSLKPSDAAKLQYADIVFWGGENIESFLAKPLSSLSKKAKVVSMLRMKGLKLKSFRSIEYLRKSENFETYKKKLVKDQVSEKQLKIDPHIWLNPENAKVMTSEIVKILSEYDPENAQKYKINGKNINIRLTELDQHLSNEMREISNLNYLVLHDAYQYFESRYQLSSAGSITLNLGHFLGARRLQKVQNMIIKNSVLCIFGEPQFSQKFLVTLTKGTSVKMGILDPIGFDLLPGPELYFDLMKNLSNSLKSCLK